MLVECKQCNAIVDAVAHGEFESQDVEVGEDYRYSLLSCPKCNVAILVAQMLCAVSETEYQWGEAFRLYPRPDRVPNYTWPAVIQDSYSEALRCYNARAYTATAVMCRNVLEGLCEEHKYSRGDLANRLNKMKDDGLIESRLYEWADALRLLGNEAAHGVGISFLKEDASDILDFTQAILEYVFTFRDQFKDFQARREKQSC